MDELGEKGYQKCILDDWVGALAIWDDAIRRYPKEKRFYNNRALCYFHRKEYMRALADARYMTSHFPDYIRGHFREGEILSAMGKYEESYKCFTRARKLDPNNIEAINELAEAQIQILRKKGWTRYQAGCAITAAQDIQEAEQILKAGAISSKDSELYLSEDEDIHIATPKKIASTVYDAREDPSNPMKSYTLWIGNMTEKLTDSQVANFFKPYGEVKSAKLCLDKYCAFVNFARHESASKAMKALQGTDLGGNKKVVLRWPDKVLKGRES
ncbi:small glutamine-rich tetratricopeptide repeat-containing protein 2-like [Thrips palmi]|uniref:Small glutamine-rich tetratricopeptide repeat-containing protein 2-like n=1 Tax=Thrips palmi TaxID=161013 RepID=A0A6P8ZSS5_THRPL|nr:small glutamine-rich tetratricopeptide repeat-containing protein 2-like [Thrips palmi]